MRPVAAPRELTEHSRVHSRAREALATAAMTGGEVLTGSAARRG